MSPTPRYPSIKTQPFVFVDLNKCILCTRCVRACAEVQGRFVWGISERGFESHLAAGMDQTMLEAAVNLRRLRGLLSYRSARA
jgi:formate dehydrogenase major subunit/formate dehydrogenase alpha subunit